MISHQSPTESHPYGWLLHAKVQVLLASPSCHQFTREIAIDTDQRGTLSLGLAGYPEHGVTVDFRTFARRM
jgi:hypothetical protein